MVKILFVCHGNNCRSTKGEYVMKDLVRKAGCAEEFCIDSAATSREEIGNGVHYGTRRKLAEMGVPCGDHRARQMTAADYDEFDLLIGMDDANIRNMNRIAGGDPERKIHRMLEYAGRGREEVADPWYTGNFDATWNDVFAGCKGLLRHLGY